MIAGIDYSSDAIDVVLLDDDDDLAKWYRVRIRHGKHDAFQSARNVRDAMPASGRWLDDGIVAVGIERPFGHPATVTVLTRIQGAILACIPRRGIDVHEFAASTWKRELCGHGHAGKPAVREAATRYFPATLLPNTFPQDAFDACGIAVAARAAYRKPTTRKGMAA